jgi:hypothetical protein
MGSPIGVTMAHILGGHSSPPLPPNPSPPLPPIPSLPSSFPLPPPPLLSLPFPPLRPLPSPFSPLMASDSEPKNFLEMLDARR